VRTRWILWLTCAATLAAQGCGKDREKKHKVTKRMVPAKPKAPPRPAPRKPSSLPAEKPPHAMTFRIGSIKTRYFWGEGRLAARVELTNVLPKRSGGNLCVVIKDEHGDEIHKLTSYSVSLGRGSTRVISAQHSLAPDNWRAAASLSVYVTRYNCKTDTKNDLSARHATTPDGTPVTERPALRPVDWPFQVRSATASLDTKTGKLTAKVEVTATEPVRGHACLAMVDKNGFVTEYVPVDRIDIDRGEKRTASTTRSITVSRWKSAAKVEAFMTNGCNRYGRVISARVPVKR
jgi:hypothetical protein